MSSTLIKLYRAIQPYVGKRPRRLAHSLRRKVIGDTSQLGEALFVHSLIGKDWPTWVVEVGANDGITASNSRFFVKKGWDAVLIEPNPKLYPQLVTNSRPFPKVRCVPCACSNTDGQGELQVFDDDKTGMLSTIQEREGLTRNGERAIEVSFDVRLRTLTSILDEEGTPQDFSVLSVDTEGHDLNVIQGLDFSRYQPRCIITEYHEQSEAEKHAVLQANDYEFVTEIGVNTIWLYRKQ